jgi:hypothetical protein
METWRIFTSVITTTTKQQRHGNNLLQQRNDHSERENEHHSFDQRDSDNQNHRQEKQYQVL